MRSTIETRRLILRPFESDDVEAAFAWFGDPIVMRFTPTGPDTSIEQTKARLAHYQEHQTEHGFSRWIVLDRHLGRPIGDSGLLALQEYGWIDLGFRLAQPYRGQGLATEAARAWVRAAFDDFHIDRLIAFVHPENVVSIRVLEKLGFHAERRDTIMGMNAIVFSLGANDGETDSRFRRRMSLDWTRGNLQEGLRCFHSGAFFEAHEHWESVWLAAQEPEKTFLQGLIQVAASFHHFQRGNYAGTIAISVAPPRRLPRSLCGGRGRPASSDDPPVARRPRNAVTLSPAAPSAAPNRQLRVTFLEPIFWIVSELPTIRPESIRIFVLRFETAEEVGA